MNPFTQWQGIAAPMPKANVDTDAIIAVQHVYTLKKSGLGDYLFHRWRFAPDGLEIQDFVLNRAPFRRASILVARSNFGCGSSREHAVWALADFGIRCIVAPSFASIFHENCIRNGVLPVRLDEEVVDRLLNMLERDESKEVAVDLQASRIILPDGSVNAFVLDEAQREILLKGLDSITVAERHKDDIAAFQQRDRQVRPWIWRSNS
ncbi:3-isopropylmalate/(R)-2-methylmalate dehydratase small subunit [Variovorax sp. YR750]|uniref:3-isopropylmalate dehydratase small subunit n=1 Tax=Variovorax sp. YR750 TaxID=1884384 RepID=UPI0008C06FF8|nr:3-isopropylmalate dehydratase small subunit [Variovorax sp. YR750]SEM05976.1 3-isopropylmalate/(R)-2-methylmalate dehydratase small subunit [Variovorax sp. YR750]